MREYFVEQFLDKPLDVENRLNKLGKEGWELCATQGIHMILKRIKEEPSHED